MFGRKLAIALILTIVSSIAVSAQTPSIIDEFNDWGAYSYKSDNGKVCYVLSPHKTARPLSENGRELEHGQNYLLVAQLIKQDTHYEPQVMMSYNIKKDSKVELKIKDQTFQLYAQDNVALLEDAKEEPALLAAIRGGKTATIEVVSSRTGKKRYYDFSLSGVTAALNRIKKCN